MPPGAETSSGVYLAAVLEYMTAEILELAGNAARDNKRQRITPRHIYLAIRNDDELNRMYNTFCAPKMGVLPNIHSVLIPMRRRRHWPPDSDDEEPPCEFPWNLRLCEATEILALPDSRLLIDETVAWKLARRAGIKYFAVATVAPRLEVLTTQIIAEVVKRAAAIAKLRVRVLRTRTRAAIGGSHAHMHVCERAARV